MVSYRNNTFIIGMMVIAAIVLSVFSSAFAHTSLEKTAPQSGERVPQSPSAIELWFQGDVVVYSNSIKVTNGEGEDFDTGEPLVDPTNSRHVTTQLHEGLPPGNYTVHIHVLAPDGDPLRERYSFMVKEAPPTQEEPQLSTEEAWKLLELETSSPSDGVIVASSPEQIELWFTQPAQLSAFGLFDDRQGAVLINDPYTDPDDPRHHIIKLKNELSPGTYSAHWYATIEGKSKNGVFYFAVNEVSSIVPPQGRAVNDFFPQVTIKSLASWLAFLGVLTLFGGTWFYVVIAKQEGYVQRWKKASLFLYGVSILGLLLTVYYYWLEFTQISWTEFISFSFVWLPLVQMVLLSLSYAAGQGKRSLWLCGLTVVLWAFTGHSVQSSYGGSIGVLIDSLHLFAISIWMGGLFALFMFMPMEEPVSWLKEKGKRYAKWAFWSIIVIILTGLWMTLKYVPSFTWKSLISSQWGTMLGIKVILLSTIILIGYFQRRSLQRLTHKVVIPFFYRAKIELVVGLIVLLVAAFLIDLSPSAAEQGIYPDKVVQDGVEATVQVSPFQVGANDITIQFTPHAEIENVRVNLSMPPQWRVDHQAFSLGQGTYRLTGNFLHASGTVYMEVKAKTTNGNEMIFPFQIKVPGDYPSN